jgi:superfamily II DNA or RNA helicase
MKLRPYQRQGLESIQSGYADGVTRQLVAMPTGSGKTVLFASLPSLTGVPSGQIMVLAHREELLDQAADKIRKWNPTLTVSIEQAARFADSNADIIVASVATLGRKVSKRRERFDWDKITTLVIDEAHHATASTYKTLLTEGGFLDEKSTKLLLGVTATPNRADGTPLAEVFEEIVFSYPLRQCIEDGWLSDLTCFRVATKTCLDDVHTVAGDFNQGELSDEVNTPERNKIIVDAWLQHGAGRQTIAFAVDIQHAVDLAAMFQSRGVKAHAVWGDDPNRAEKIAAYKRGDIMVLTNCGVLTEGYDDPEVSCIVTARPTKSSLLFQQMIGRGTRLETGVENRLTHPTPLRKPNCLILDVIDNSKRHSLATIPSLFGMPELQLRGRSVIASLKTLEDAERAYPQINLAGLTDIENLERYIESVSLWEVKFDPEVVEHSALSWFHTMDGYVLSMPNQERATIKQNLLGKFEILITLNGTEYSGERDSLEVAFKAADATISEHGNNIIGMISRDQTWHKDAITDKQMATLRKLYKGKAVPSNLSKGAASKLISQFFATAGPRPARPAWLQRRIDERKRA